MKKLFLSLAAAAFLLMPCTSHASNADQLGIYVAPKFVLNVQHSEGEVSYYGHNIGSDDKDGARAGGAIAIGYDFAPQFNIPVRAELEYGAYGIISKTVSYPGASFKGEVGFQTLLANFYWDITEWNGFTPYIGAGIGMASLTTEGTVNIAGWGAGSKDETDAVAAGQIGLGCSYAFTDSISADLGYRYLMIDDGEVEDYGMKLRSSENHVHQFMLGLRVTF